MRDLLANLLGRLRQTSRQQRLMLALGLMLFLVLTRFGLTSLIEYRKQVKEDIQLSAQRLANAKHLVARAATTQKELEELKARYGEAIGQLVPGSSPTLAAAALQDRLSSLAAEKGIQIQTTQVLKDEPIGPFRQVSLRVTASGEIGSLAGFLAALEYGPLRVSVPFIELNRRGAVVRRPGMAEPNRAVSATIQIAGIIQGSAQAPGAEAAPDAEPAAQPARAARVPVPAPPASAPPAGGEAGLPAPPAIPNDALGTSGLLGES